MRSTLPYLSARILLLVAAGGLLYLVGARGWLLLLLAFLVSGIASYVLLSGQRDRISTSITARRAGRRKVSIGARLNEGASVEDDGSMITAEDLAHHRVQDPP
jgi:hypothetical protein